MTPSTGTIALLALSTLSISSKTTASLTGLPKDKLSISNHTGDLFVQGKTRLNLEVSFGQLSGLESDKSLHGKRIVRNWKWFSIYQAKRSLMTYDHGYLFVSGSGLYFVNFKMHITVPADARDTLYNNFNIRVMHYDALNKKNDVLGISLISACDENTVPTSCQIDTSFICSLNAGDAVYLEVSHFELLSDEFYISFLELWFIR